MAEAGVDALLVRSTDRFLNEYVPIEDSTRVWLTGFTGSMGEALVTKDRAYVAVDGRYWLQVDKQIDGAAFEAVKVSVGQSTDQALWERIKALGAIKVGFEQHKTTPSEVDSMKKAIGPQATWVGLTPSPVDLALGSRESAAAPYNLRVLDEARVGATVDEKLATLANKLETLGIDALLVQRLDEIAYLTNLRGDELPYQATFKAVALASADRVLVGVEDPSRISAEVRAARPRLSFVSEADVWAAAKNGKVGYDPHHNTELGRAQIAQPVIVESPVGPMKAKKNKAELEVMVEAFARADAVVDRAQRWLSSEIAAKRKITEADFADQVRALFTESGAVGLSFKVISAAGKNGAVIHYSDPSPTRVIKKGELMLLDTGAYYAEGYATDLTRTFLVGGARDKATQEQRRHYTYVLKSAIAGMSATIPDGARGYQLDAIVRAPLWAVGLDYNHGTGHGVGVNVHEFPPRVGPTSAAKLEEGYVFSIEPGVYLPAFGGVRIENLCTLERSKSKPGYLEVVPLTFSPLDARLIDAKLLSPTEKAWLAKYAKVHGSPARRRLRGDTAKTLVKRARAAAKRAP